MKKTLLIASLFVLSTACQRNPDNRQVNQPNMRSDARDRKDRMDHCGYDNSGNPVGSYNQAPQGLNTRSYSNAPQQRSQNPNAPQNNGALVNDQEDDWTVNERVRDALYNDPSSPPFARAIQVETRDRVVTLTGNLPTKQDVDFIIRKVKGVRGVRSVNNQISVGQGAQGQN
jgi:hypothetical protein